MEPQTKLIVLDDTAWDNPAARESTIAILLARGDADVAVSANSRFTSGCDMEEDGNGYRWDRSWGATPVDAGIEIAKMDYQRFAVEVARTLAARGDKPTGQGLVIALAADEREVPESAERHVKRALEAGREVVCLCGPDRRTAFEKLFEDALPPKAARLSLPI